MLKLKKYNAKNIDEIKSFIVNNPYLSSDLSIGFFDMWGKGINLRYAVENGFLIIECDSKKTAYFYPPISKNGNKGDYLVLKEMQNHAKACGKQFSIVGVEEEYLHTYKEKFNVSEVSFDRNYSDYIYAYEDVKSFIGKKYSGQRNHINTFKKLYPSFEYQSLQSVSKGQIKTFLKEYKKQHKFLSDIEKAEYKGTKTLIKRLPENYYVSGCITLNGKVIAISIGEYVGKMLVIHIEKALAEYKGIYPVMFNEFVKHSEKQNIVFVNREDDSGDEGLRTSKMQYHPEKIVNKYYLKIKN